jgi:hypothetical protein
MLFTLIGQGTTIQFLLRRLGLIERPEHVIERERYMGQLLATQAGMRRLDDLRREGILLDKIWQSLHADYIQTRETLTEEIDQ